MKRVLYIAYYWPPAGGIGVVRNLKFTKYFRESGWEPVIYAPSGATYPIFDPATEKDLPEHAEIIRTPIFEPYGAFNLAKGKKKKDSVKDVFLVKDSGSSLIHRIGIWIRANFFVPDARSFWIKPSIRYLRKYLRENPVDAIISYGPPHSMHMIALALHKEFGTPWISDWQDPWTQIDYYEKFPMTNGVKRKHERMEQEVLATASKVVMVSKSWTKDLEKLSGRKVDYIPFGYDEKDFEGLTYRKGRHFIISHFGTFGSDRNTEALWMALQELKTENPGFADHLQIHLAGHVDVSVFTSISQAGLKENLRYDQHLGKSEFFRHLMNSNITLVLINKPEPSSNYNNKGRIPAKLFENIGSQRPILVIGDEDCDVAKIVAETKTGETCGYDKKDKMKTYIRSCYRHWLNDTTPTHPEHTGRYSFQSLTKQMAKLLDEISSSDRA